MMIELPSDRDIQSQAIAAGFASVEDYVRTLLDRDAERVAIQEGIDDMNAGRMQPWEEVDAEIRREFGVPPRA
jgi:predicted transcriptional regulator